MLEHEFWLARIQDPCIIGLDLLVHWGAVVDLVKSTLPLGPLTVDLQPEKRTRKRQRTRKVTPRGVVPAVAVQIQAVPAAAVQVVPAAAVQAVPAVTVQAIPVAAVQAVPAAAVQAVPEAAVQAVPAGAVQAVPAAAVQVVQAVKVQAVPAAAVQVVPAVTVQAVPEAAVQAVPAAADRVVQAVEVQAVEAQAVLAAAVQAVPVATVQAVPEAAVQAVPAAAVQVAEAVEVQVVPAVAVQAVPAAVVPDVAVPAVAVPAVVSAAVQAADHRSPTPAGACTASPRAIPPPSTETVNAVKELWQRSSEGLDQCQKEQLKHLLDRYVDIFAARDEDCTQTRLVQHSIDTGSAPPIRLRPHRLALSKRQLAEDMIHKMLAAGIIEPSSSPWAAPVVLVRKRLGGWRFCVDYRRLNAVTKKDSYPLPRIDDALDYISGSSWFSSLDMRSGYWQVELSPQAWAKTAFTFGQGLWQFRVMPFGLCNAPATFERLIERVLTDIPRSHCVVYLDDLLVHASDFSKALGHLSGVFSAICHAGLRLNPAKCHLLQRETTFLGHVVSAEGVATNPEKVAAVQDWPIPVNVRDLRSFLGLASYYRRFFRNFASVAGPLHRLTDKGKPFVWTNSCDTAFNQLKAALTAAPILAYPHVDLPYVVDTDASGTGIGAVLSQQGGEGERVVGYYSRALSREERNYCVTRRELLAVVMAVHHFRPYLHGNKFLLRTDHASLTWLLSFKQPEGQVARWLEVLQTYNFDIQHRPGQQHNNADALSRRPCVIAECRYCERQEERDRDKPRVSTATINPPDDLSSEQLQQQQESDTTLALIRKWLELPRRPEWPAVSPHGTDIKAYYSQWGNIELRNGLLFRRWRAPGQGKDILQLLVPRSLQPQVLQSVHGSIGSGHFGISKTLHRLRGRFYWPGCRQDVEIHVHCCDLCTARKGPTQRSHAPLQQYLVGAPMERVGVDILGPFPVTDTGNRYVLVAMDYFTKWPEAYAVPDQSAATTAGRLVDEMFTRFGVPSELHSDQGRNFESQVFSEVCRLLAIKKARTTLLHPQSDGLVERFNRTLATQLAILVSKHQRDWDRYLPLVLWAYRTAVQESSQCTPAALMFGRELRTPVDLVFGSPPEPEIAGGHEMDYFQRLREHLRVVHDYTRQVQASSGVRQKRAYDSHCRGQPFQPGDKVWVYCPDRKKGISPKLCSHWRGPAEVVAHLSDVVYRVRIPNKGRFVVLHRDRLALYRPYAPETVGEVDGLLVQVHLSPRRPIRQRRQPGHLRDYVLFDGVVGDD
ncbi:unnamed protein product [Knipowitschia caucasica]